MLGDRRNCGSGRSPTRLGSSRLQNGNDWIMKGDIHPSGGSVQWAGRSAGCSRANSPTIQNLSMRKMLRPFSAVLTKLQRSGRPVVDQPPLPAIDWPSRDAVINGFRFILGREPGNENAIDEHARIPSFAAFRQALLGSEEFRGNFKVMFPEAYGHPSLTMGRETLAFIHLQKTGGTSLRTMLERQFPADRRCPIRGD